jgi:lysophospholipase L1-like esterase
MTPDPTLPSAPDAPRGRSLVVTLGAMCVVILLAEVAAAVVTSGAPGDWGVARISQKVAQIDALGSADVVFLGDSTVEVGFDPAVLQAAAPGLGRAYNAALPAASPELWRLWMEDVVAPGLAPETVVIGITSLSFNDTGTFRSDVTSRYRRSPARDDFGRLDVRRWSALVRHRAALRRPVTWFGVDDADPQLSSQGHDTTTRARSYGVPESFAMRMREEVLVGYDIGGAQVEHLEELVARLRAGGVEVIVVDMPVVLEDHVTLHDGGARAYAEYVALVDRLEAELGVPVVRPPQGLLDEDDFADPVHVNGVGTQALTEWLAAVLVTR